MPMRLLRTIALMIALGALFIVTPVAADEPSPHQREKTPVKAKGPVRITDEELDRHGYTGEDGLSIMPSYADLLTLQEWIDLVAYLKSLNGGSPQPGEGRH